MAEEEREEDFDKGDFDKEDFDKIELTTEGETLGYISLEQARLLAMQTARDNPGNYGRRFSGSSMVFDIAEQEDGEDYYIITMNFRPKGDFAGTTGQEQFFIEKEGAVAHRQVRSLPSAVGRRRLPVLPIGIGLVVIIIVAVIGVALATRSSGTEESPAAIVVTTNTSPQPQAPTQPPAGLGIAPPQESPTPTAVPVLTSTEAPAIIAQPTPIIMPAEPLVSILQ